MAHVFISYKRKDSDFAELVKRQIEEAGFDVWMDTKIRAGDNWREAIDNAIRDSFACVLIMTPAAKQSEYVTYEWACAWGAGIRIIPIMLEDTPLHERLDAFQYVDYRLEGDSMWPPLVQLLTELANRPIRRNDGGQDVQSAQLLIPELLDELRTGEPQQQLAAARTLAQLGVVGIFPHLVRAYNNTNDLNVRRELLRALGNSGDAAVPLLLDTLIDSNLGGIASEALARIGGDEVVARLIELLASGNDSLVCHAANALGKIGDPRAIPALSMYNVLSRLGCTVEALGAINHPSCVPPLLQASSGYDSGTRGEANVALNQLDEAVRHKGLISIIEDYDDEYKKRPEVVDTALRWIANQRITEAEDVLLSIRHKATQHQIVETLGKIGSARSVPTIQELLRSRSVDRYYAVNALQQIGDKSSIPTIKSALRDRKKYVRITARRALTALGVFLPFVLLMQWRNKFIVTVIGALVMLLVAGLGLPLYHVIIIALVEIIILLGIGAYWTWGF